MKKIFTEIRRDVEEARARPDLTELYKRVGYLITLTHAPSWEEKFGKEAAQLRKVAKEEFGTTAQDQSPCRADWHRSGLRRNLGVGTMTAAATHRYKTTESKYKGGAKEMYVTYDLRQTTRGEGRALYPKVKRVYIAGTVTYWQVGTFAKRTGKTVHGVKIDYAQGRQEYTRKGYTAKRGSTLTASPKQWVPHRANQSPLKQSHVAGNDCGNASQDGDGHPPAPR